MRKRKEFVQIGWVVKALMMVQGRKVEKIISKNFSSKSAAELYAKLAEKDIEHLKVWVEENY